MSDSNQTTIPTQALTATSGFGMRTSGGVAVLGAFAGMPVFGRERNGADVAKHPQGTPVWSPPT